MCEWPGLVGLSCLTRARTATKKTSTNHHTQQKVKLLTHPTTPPVTRVTTEKLDESKEKIRNYI